MINRQKYGGPTEQIRAEQVQIGQTVIAVDGGTVRPNQGEWPRVTCRVDHQLPIDGHVVEIQLHGRRGALFLRAADTVTIAQEPS